MQLHLRYDLKVKKASREDGAFFGGQAGLLLFSVCGMHPNAARHMRRGGGRGVL